jgi:hypothetical protein
MNTSEEAPYGESYQWPAQFDAVLPSNPVLSHGNPYPYRALPLWPSPCGATLEITVPAVHREVNAHTSKAAQSFFIVGFSQKRQVLFNLHTLL